MTALVVAGIPNPVSWGWDKLTGWVGDAISWSFESVIGGLVGWVVGAVAWVVAQVFGFVASSSSPRVATEWFAGAGSPYRLSVQAAAGLLVLALLVGIFQGIVKGDPGVVIRRVVVNTPTVVFVWVTLVAFVDLGVRLSDAVSDQLMVSFGDDTTRFLSGLANLELLSPGVTGAAASFAVFVMALLTFCAGLVIWVLLILRAALVYVVVGLAPLVAVLTVTSHQGVLRRTLETLAALIASKVVIVLALVIGVAALGSGVDGSAPIDIGIAPFDPADVVVDDAGSTVLPPTADEVDETIRAGEEQSATAAFGLLLVGFATMAVACFAPFLFIRLFPVVDGAGVAQGSARGPVNALTQAAYAKQSAQSLASSPTRRLITTTPNPTAPSTAAAASAGVRSVATQTAVAMQPPPPSRLPVTSGTGSTP